MKILSFKEIEQANFLHVYLIFSKWKLLNIHKRKENNILNLCVCVCMYLVVSDSFATLLGLIPGSGRSPGEGNGNTLPYSCLENPRDGGAW